MTERTGVKKINPDNIIKKLNLSDGNVGDTNGDKRRRQLRSDLERMKKDKRVEWLREHFPDDPVWKKLI